MQEYIKEEMIFVKFGRGLKQYPFSFVELRTPGNTNPIGSGMAPAGPMVINETQQFLASDRDIPELSQNFIIDPPFIYDGSVQVGLKNPW
jgi:hypothetical protein